MGNPDRMTALPDSQGGSYSMVGWKELAVILLWLQSPPEISSPLGVAQLVLLVLVVWLGAQWMLGGIWQRSLNFCPQCLSPDTRRSHRRRWELLIPLYRPRRCRNCGCRFWRGGRPLHACCSRCGTTHLQPTPRHRVRERNLRAFVLRLRGARAYRCPLCRRSFFDSRPLQRIEMSKETEGSAAQAADPAAEPAKEDL